MESHAVTEEQIQHVPDPSQPLGLFPPRTVPPGTFAGYPTFLRAHLDAASQGGAGGYAEAGFHFGLHVHSMEPFDTDSDEWAEIIAAELVPLIARRDDAAVVAWLLRRYPRIMPRVQARRHQNFLSGFYRGFAKAAE